MFAISGVGEAGKNIVAGEVVEVCNNFLSSHAGGEVRENIIDSDPHPSNARFATALTRFKGDDVLVIHEWLLGSPFGNFMLLIVIDYSRPLIRSLLLHLPQQVLRQRML